MGLNRRALVRPISEAHPMYQCICVIDDWSSMDLAEVLKDVAQPSEGAIELYEAASERVH